MQLLQRKLRVKGMKSSQEQTDRNKYLLLKHMVLDRNEIFQGHERTIKEQKQKIAEQEEKIEGLSAKVTLAQQRHTVSCQMVQEKAMRAETIQELNNLYLKESMSVKHYKVLVDDLGRSFSASGCQWD